MRFGGVRTLVERRVIRRSWPATLALVAILAISAGSTMAAAAGGRRAATSYDRLIAWSDGTVASVNGGASGDSETADATFTHLAALPEVAASLRSVALGDGVVVRGELVTFPGLVPVALETSDASFGRSRLLAGRLPRLDAINEAMVPFDTAERFDLKVGDAVDVRFDEWDDRPDFVASVETVEVVGIVAYPGSFPSVTAEPTDVVLLTPAFLSAHEDRVDWTNGDLQVKLRDNTPAGVAAFRSTVAASGVPVDFVYSLYDDALGVRNLVRVEAGVLWLTAAVLAAAAVIVAIQFFRREAADAAIDLGVLRSVGMRRSTIAGAGALHGCIVGIAGAIGATVIAYALSPLLPRGVARIADPRVGFHADLTAITVGTALVVSIATAIGAGSAAWVAGSHHDTSESTPRLNRFVTGLPTAAATGLRAAFAPTASGPGSSVRIGIVGLAVILSALIGVASLRASFDRVLAEPALSGATWDVTAVWGEEPVVTEAAAQALESDPDVEAFTHGGWSQIAVNGKDVYVVYLEPGNDVEVATDLGRSPVGPDEIALGRAEMAALDVGIGDHVEVGASNSDQSQAGSDGTDATRSATITGRSILSAPVYQQLAAGEGGAVTTELMAQILGERPPSGAFISLTDAESLRDAATGLTERIQPAFSFTRPDRAGVRSLRDVRQLPSVLLAMLGLMAAAALVHRLVMRSRSARREQAVLRSLGFTGEQFAIAGAVQGGAVSVLALLGAIPLGLLGAAIAWRRIADYLRVVPSPAVPIDIVIAVGGLAVALAVSAGVVLSRRARRAHPGVVLRSE